MSLRQWIADLMCPLSRPKSNLVQHARTELKLAGCDKWETNGILKIMQVFANMGHSCGSASAAIPMINDLLQFKNLTPLTCDPAEWEHHPGETWGGTDPGIWQNRRNPEAFSSDGGKTYYLLSEREEDTGKYPLHVSETVSADGVVIGTRKI